MSGTKKESGRFHLDLGLRDIDPQETREWLNSYDAVLEREGSERANFLLTQLLRRSGMRKLAMPPLIQTPYVNTIPPEKEPPYPGDEKIEKTIRRYIRWNAAIMVLRANRQSPGIGGHLGTYASAATLYEVGFHHFFRGKDAGFGDMVFFQGHAAPGIYARAFLEGRLGTKRLEGFRREISRQGLSSYPHPWLMPDFWEFPTVSMGLGPLQAIYQAQFNRYLMARGLADTSGTRVWCFVGDGECDEPETLGALHLASREELGNLVFVVNCNLQRLDGPVRGNAKIIQELEAVFKGAGWRVIKVIWGREWDPLIAADEHGLLVRRMGEVIDGEYQKYMVDRSGAYVRQHFFGADPRVLKMVEHLSDDDIYHLRRGGHDARKVYAAFHEACREPDKPVVILAKTVKGWGLGDATQGRNIVHQAKKLDLNDLKDFRDRLELPISDEQLEDPPFQRLKPGGPEERYLLERRRALGGFLPQRRVRKKSLRVPPLDWFQPYLQGSGQQEASTTGVFARILSQLMGDPDIGRRIVPIIPDEARSFGLDALFNKYGIYAHKGQLYEPVDAHLLLSYREAKDGQVLEEGICEAGSMAHLTAAGTSYAAFGEPLIPFYIFYSMFGFQRTGDQAWAQGDQRVRGFLLGGTSGRTTLNGEGLQHADGHSLLLASTFPHVRAYDPAYAYEIAVILQEGMRRMVEAQEDVIYYICLQNEAYAQPAMPEGLREGILAGLYPCAESPDLAADGPRVEILGSGAILREALRAQGLLAAAGVAARVWSATSYGELRREGLSADRWNRLHPAEPRRDPLVRRLLCDGDQPIIAVGDSLAAVPDQIARWLDGRLLSLGTDGFGRSDTRAALRRHFEVDAEHIALAALSALVARGRYQAARAEALRDEWGVDPEKPDPATA